jgi:hypothetical protein
VREAHRWREQYRAAKDRVAAEDAARASPHSAA